ncbi:uncharacterized protein SOCE836_031990 [Sorangium cellulosum]|uniref:Uncharacterized protein n=1 Tax=Sorangium cellulosum TaxID=56 RepID=A0A4P2QMP8_SORCE|nr:hypothetical protein [Sorangium cellulosum]AUX31081.1 uncharacterized protein SOCE836_031990 [Sorangium cellulosum]
MSTATVEFAGIELLSPCPHCSAPMAVNTLTDRCRCSSCLMESALPPSAWDEALRGVEKDVVQFAPGYLRHGPEWGEGGPPPGPHVAWQRGHDAPPCPRCQRPMRLVPQGGCVCAACGAGRAILPKPPWLPPGSPVLGFVSDEPAVAEERPREPVQVACTQCGGPLVADGSSRIVPCGYCSARVALPDAVWAALHPPRVKRRWWLVVHAADDPRRGPANILRFQMPAVTIGGILGILGGFFILFAPVWFEHGDTAMFVGFGVPAAVFLCLWLWTRMRYWRICRPENEVVGRLSAHWSSGFRTEVLITSPNRPADVLARADLWALDRRRFDELGGEGGRVRAWMVPGKPGLTYVDPIPSLLE